ncbi:MULTISPECIES: M28 family metallopeptidase [unclassified Pedobacter]|uniref:M28 family metallopeptidase n=1 Tax=unclassified Pedobacter TaxID=2628915 RepID=UPI00141DF9D5|nr:MULTISPECIES: M28 family metallopeptidase [unclassified Pedobacter]NII83579.1 Zn-dependent M28 family amino/carboxypeptidase [Pedobacter sp. SG908]NMN37442.1 Zn-dependent M28 family amino/carboxypeptidase [Pedobacter sp. SG918]
MKKILLLSSCALLFFSSCKQGTKSTDISVDSLAVKAINDSSLTQYLSVIAADSLEGRKPFTNGETKTINYLKTQFEKLGLQPGNGDSFFQEVPMVEIKSVPEDKMVLKGKTASLTLNYLTDFVAGTRRVQDEVSMSNSPLVFAGYGIVAPEYGWNDYANLDVKGKTVVVLINDPGFADSTLFKGKNMTYYGRWTYKFEEAARQGATGIIIVHDTEPAAYPWTVVRSGWSKSKLTLQSEDNGMSRAVVEGWITLDKAKQLFALDGKSFDQLALSARKKGFKAVDLNITTSLKVKNTIKKSVTYNVLAKIPGDKRKDEAIIYSAHWDHLGVGEKIQGDSIYNGAVDNATGLAALFEIASAFKKLPKVPGRTILFISYTAEEQGLLGSEYYAKHPVFSLAKTVANINMDMMGIAGKTKDIVVYGFGQSELEDYAAAAAKKQGRVIVPDPVPSSGLYYRSDHFNLAKVGVPSLFTGSGVDNIKNGREWGLKQVADFTKFRYHSPQDNFDAKKWDLSGIIEDVRMLFDMGYRISNEDSYPKWKDGSEFKAIREKK